MQALYLSNYGSHVTLIWPHLKTWAKKNTGGMDATQEEDHGGPRRVHQLLLAHLSATTTHKTFPLISQTVTGYFIS